MQFVVGLIVAFFVVKSLNRMDDRETGGSGGDIERPFTGEDITNQSGQTITDNFADPVRQWADEVKEWAKIHDVRPEIILSIIQQESTGNPDATGAIGERGLMQVTEIALQDVNENFNSFPYQSDIDFADLVRPNANIKAGTAFYRLQLDRMNGSDYDALRAYNCGAQGAKENPGCGSQYADEVLNRTKNDTRTG